MAVFADGCLRVIREQYKSMEILDLGCGYGRDAFYLAQSLKSNVLGIDNAREAIEMARKALAGDIKSRVKFQYCGFNQISGYEFDIVFASNLYQVLEIEERKALREVIKRSLKPNGMLFLSALSTRDPHHFGKGKRIENENNSFQDEKFLHFCTKEEIEKDFSFLNIKELIEHEYDEPRSNGEIHHHISWLLLGINP
ncbi:MAG: class I SAM-dependent methyltransferase [Chloroflexota bacterium]